jgi:predicted phage terminase large subunit-like protein
MDKWSREHEQLRARGLELIEKHATPFRRTGQAARRTRMGLDFLPWCCLYLPHYFDCDFAPFHRRMADAAGEAGMPTFICAFRGAGKSVLLALARPLRRALRGEAPYFIYGSQVQKLAAQNMDYLRLELEHNPRIAGDYGQPQVGGSQTEWTLSLPLEQGTAKFEAFGIGMSPRGRRHAEHRPLEFIGDDLEDAELARNPEREQNLWDWLMDEVLPALEPERYAFTVLGTMFGPDCMMQRAVRLAGRTDGRGRPLARTFLQKVADEGRSVWPDRFPDPTLARIRATIGLRNWLRNYALEPEDPAKPFQARWMATYRPDEVSPARLDVVAFLDPAVSQAPSGCPRALVAVGADRSSGLRYVLEAWIERGTPMEMLSKLSEFHRRFRPRVIGIESNGGYALIRPLLGLWGRDRGERLPVRYVQHTRPKDLRIEMLCPQFESGRWLFPQHPSPGVQMLQEQFLSYPHGYVDGPDAAAGCDELLPSAFGPAQGALKEAGYLRLQRRADYSAL